MMLFQLLSLDDSSGTQKVPSEEYLNSTQVSFSDLPIAKTNDSKPICYSSSDAGLGIRTPSLSQPNQKNYYVGKIKEDPMLG